MKDWPDHFPSSLSFGPSIICAVALVYENIFWPIKHTVCVSASAGVTALGVSVHYSEGLLNEKVTHSNFRFKVVV